MAEAGDRPALTLGTPGGVQRLAFWWRQYPGAKGLLGSLVLLAAGFGAAALGWNVAALVCFFSSVYGLQAYRSSAALRRPAWPPAPFHLLGRRRRR